MTQTRRPMPPPLKMPAPGLWRRTPPAIFPPIFGLFGLGLGWRAAGSVTGDILLGGVTLLFLFALVAYLAKPLRRPGVLIEEMRVLPGRAGLAAASLSLMLMAASLAPIAPRLAMVTGFVAFALHLGLVGLLVFVLRRAPPEGRVVTPVFHLSFVGFIVGGVVANALGYPQVATFLLWSMLLPAGVIWGISARQLVQRTPPAPLRPLLAIHLAPACLFAIVAHGAGLEAAAMGFSAVAAVIFAALILSLRWLTQSGFSALWGAFTFPLAAFASALMLVSQPQSIPGLIGLGVLFCATPIVVIIAFRIFKMWASGTLAAKTNAAEA